MSRIDRQRIHLVLDFFQGSLRASIQMFITGLSKMLCHRTIISEMVAFQINVSQWLYKLATRLVFSGTVRDRIALEKFYYIFRFVVNGTATRRSLCFVIFFVLFWFCRSTGIMAGINCSVLSFISFRFGCRPWVCVISPYMTTYTFPLVFSPIRPCLARYKNYRHQ